jgi:hypothetical protein
LKRPGAAKNKEYGWIQDILQNHMAVDSDNRLLMDIFRSNRPPYRAYLSRRLSLTSSVTSRQDARGNSDGIAQLRERSRLRPRCPHDPHCSSSASSYRAPASPGLPKRILVFVELLLCRAVDVRVGLLLVT